MSTIKLESSDGKRFEICLETAKQMGTVRNLMESFDDVDDDTILPLPQVNGAILGQVLRWCDHHKLDEILPVSDGTKKARGEIEDPFDKDFVDVPNHQLFDYILAANYLAIEGLLELTCKAVSDMMKGKTPKEIREKFELMEDNEKNDMVQPAKKFAK